MLIGNRTVLKQSGMMLVVVGLPLKLLPLGFHFYPIDVELVNQIHINGCIRSEMEVILKIDVCKYDLDRKVRSLFVFQLLGCIYNRAGLAISQDSQMKGTPTGGCRG